MSLPTKDLFRYAEEYADEVGKKSRKTRSARKSYGEKIYRILADFISFVYIRKD